MSKPITYDRTMNLLSKTGTATFTQRAETRSAKPSNSAAVFSKSSPRPSPIVTGPYDLVHYRRVQNKAGRYSAWARAPSNTRNSATFSRNQVAITSI